MGIGDDFLNGINDAQDFLNGINPLSAGEKAGLREDGFLLPAGYSADSNNLPFTQVPTYRDAQIKRNIITWFVPEFGVVRMYVNPQSIQYAFKKAINKERTKGGFALQYWGEELTTLNISGTTGSSGVEGINALYEIYRAEQYAFDSSGLIISANNSANPAASLATDGLNALGGLVGGEAGGALFGGPGAGGGLVGNLLGLNSPSSQFAGAQYTSLAQLAFTVEMYYGGWVFRGFFESFNMTESANNFLWDYNINFTVTQKRGYRTNYFPWSKNPANGPSTYSTPSSFSGTIKG